MKKCGWLMIARLQCFLCWREKLSWCWSRGILWQLQSALWNAEGVPCFLSFLIPRVKPERGIRDSNSWFLSLYLFIAAWLLFMEHGYRTCMLKKCLSSFPSAVWPLGSDCTQVQSFTEQGPWARLSYPTAQGKGLILQGRKEITWTMPFCKLWPLL